MKNILYTFVLPFVFPILVWGQSTDQNYKKSTTYQQPYTQTEVEAGGIPIDDKIETITYYDGLGRPIENIAQRAGGNREDLITPVYYDVIGRKPKDWLPLPVTGNVNGAYYEGSGGNSITDEIKTYYLAKFYDDFIQGVGPDYENPYSNTSYESSPINRITEKAAPGSEWRLSAHSIRFDYQTNSTNEVREFTVVYGTDYTDPSLDYVGYYPTNELYKNITKDENWTTSDGNNKTVQEFTDKKGKTILKRAFNNGIAHDTYYVYDAEGHLMYVISPGGTDNILDGNNDIITSAVEKYCYQYIYDNRGRLTAKRIPGRDGWDYIFYDILDRPILTQDPKLKADGDKWLFTKYDDFDRVVYTGILSDYTRTQADTAVKGMGQQLSEEVKPTGSIIDGTTIYYTKQVFPTTNIKVLTVNYYDTYRDMGSMGSMPTANYYSTTITTNTKGLPTVSKVRVLDGIDDSTPTQHWITTRTGYDDKARPIYVESENPYLDTTDLIESQLDFTGKPIETKTHHTYSGTASQDITTFDYFTYDHMGRPVAHEQKIEDNSVQLIAKNYYDEIGQAYQKEVGGETYVDGYTDIDNVTVTPYGMVEKIAGGSGWNSGLKTKGVIPADTDGGISAIIVTANKKQKFGLYKSTTGLDPYDKLEIGLVATGQVSSGSEYVLKYVIGNTEYTTTETYEAGETFTIKRVGTAFKFYKGTSTSDFLSVSATNSALVGKAHYYDMGAQMDELHLIGDTIDKILQVVDYKYNVRGWLTDINDIEATGIGDTDLFKFRINYKVVEGNSNGTELFNGNIAQTLWKTKTSSTPKVRGYNYQYDDLNRITDARYYEASTIAQMTSPVDTYTLDPVTYDKNGNILTLFRMGTDDSNSTGDAWDNLTYYYDGNQLLNVKDLADPITQFGNEGFLDGNIGEGPAADDYAYDENGNLTKDLNKDITTILYDSHLDLPTSISVGGGSTGGIAYVYDALGTKLKKTVVESGQANQVTLYAGGYTYLNGDLQFFPHPEGYVNHEEGVIESIGGVMTVSYYNYVFQYLDHLGNVRLSYGDFDKNGVINTSAFAGSEIIEESNYYPFGLKQKGYNNTISGGNSLAQRWKYNGVELNEDLSINLYEMDLRSYDPAIGRFNGIDPVTHFSQGTSVAFDNNPVYWTDPSGANAIVGTGGFSCFDCGSGVVRGSDIAEGALKGNDGFMGGNGLTRTESNARGKAIKNPIRSIITGKPISLSPNAGNSGLEAAILNNIEGNQIDPYRQQQVTGATNVMTLTGKTLSVLGVSLLSSSQFSKYSTYILDGAVDGVSHIYNVKSLDYTTGTGLRNLGRAFGGASLFFTYRAYQSGEISGVTAGYDAGFTTYGLIGGPFGLFFSGLYSTFNIIIPADYRMKVMTERAKRARKAKTHDEAKRIMGSCFVKGTDVLMSDLSIKKIENIQVGDKILSVNINTMEIEEDVVLAIPNRLKKYRIIEAKFSNGVTNKFSPAHPFWVKNKGWSVFDTEDAKTELEFEVKKLELGDVVLFYKNGKLEEAKITFLKDKNSYVEMYNVEFVKKNHTFFANGILVHNKRID